MAVAAAVAAVAAAAAVAAVADASAVAAAVVPELPLSAVSIVPPSRRRRLWLQLPFVHTAAHGFL